MSQSNMSDRHTLIKFDFTMNVNHIYLAKVHY